MPALQVRDFPQDLYEGLKEAAAREHRSLAQQTVYAVEEMLSRREAGNREGARIISFDSVRARQERIAKRKALFARLEEDAKRLPSDLPRPEEVLREIRDELDTRDNEMFAIVTGRAK